LEIIEMQWVRAAGVRALNRLVLAQRLIRVNSLAGAYWNSLGGKFKDVESFCLFIGYPRSGHTLFMALLDAHPNIVIGNEVEALRYVELGVSRAYLFTLLLESSRAFVRDGARWQGYSYRVPGQWQGHFRKLRVVGDKSAGVATRLLAGKPELLPLLRETAGARVKLVHIVRNPYDNISTMHRRNPHDLETTADKYFSLCRTNAAVVTQADPASVLHLKHEQFIADPRSGLKALCDFLDVPHTEDYIEACAGIVYQAPHKSRLKSEWKPRLVDLVQAQVDEFSFLQGYSFRD
jgi:hypothetical protein